MARRGSSIGPPPHHHLHLLLLLALAAVSPLASATPSSSSKPRPLAADLPHITASSAAADAAAGAAARTCWYTVKIKTSCASPRRTTDAVSLAFGDAYRDEVYAANLASTPSSGAFERCATDTFRVGGPCGYGVCYLYLRRTGGVGWTPEWVRVYEPTSSTPSTFYYGDPLPSGVWYGFNRCPHRAGAGGDGGAAIAAV